MAVFQQIRSSPSRDGFVVVVNEIRVLVSTEMGAVPSLRRVAWLAAMYHVVLKSGTIKHDSEV